MFLDLSPNANIGLHFNVIDIIFIIKIIILDFHVLWVNVYLYNVIVFDRINRFWIEIVQFLFNHVSLWLLNIFIMQFLPYLHWNIC